MKEPYRLEGKKTMGLELADQLDWRLPDAIFYPTGGGTGLVGMWKAFGELRELGWLDAGAPLPRLFACRWRAAHGFSAGATGGWPGWSGRWPREATARTGRCRRCMGCW